MEVVNLSYLKNEQQYIATLLFSRTDKSVNVLDEICMQQLEACLSQLEENTPNILLLRSDFEHCFIAGADLELIASVDDEQEAAALARRGQEVCRRIEALSCLSIALVQGSCMGGGLEVALACDYIVAIHHPKTQLALPEIKIGIHPGFGGCVRLPKRVGWLVAVDMILSGRGLNAKQAKRKKLAALNCHPEQIEASVQYLMAKGKPEAVKLQPFWLAFPPAKWLFFQQVEKKVRQKIPHVDLQQAYPAIPATLKLLQSIVGSSEHVAYALEAESLGRMAITPTCKNLIRVFHLGEALKKQDAVRQGKPWLASVQKTAVFGAGVMGSGIAWVAAKHGDVDLHDVSAESISRGLSSLSSFAKRDKRRFSRIRPVLDMSGLASSDVVIEAVLEELEVKKKLWKQVEAEVAIDTLLLTNTSSLSVSKMQLRRKHAGRIAGMHFFNPAPKMPLVEVIAGKRSSDETIAKVCALAVSWGKYPVITSDTAGFFINRCLMPYMVAALALLEQGQRPEHIDGALKVFGMPMGALELADRVGLDICLHVGTHLADAFASEKFKMPEWLAKMVEDGFLGAKSKAGFFRYQGKKQGELNERLGSYIPAVAQAERRLANESFDADIRTDIAAFSQQEIIDACLIPMLIEALRCLQEKVIVDATHMDAAFVYGIGFPPFHGGLLRYFAGRDRARLLLNIEGLEYACPENIEVLDDFH